MYHAFFPLLLDPFSPYNVNYIVSLKSLIHGLLQWGIRISDKINHITWRQTDKLGQTVNLNSPTITDKHVIILRQLYKCGRQNPIL